MSDLQTKFDALVAKKGQDYFAEYQDHGQAVVDAINSGYGALTAASATTVTIGTGTVTVIASLNKAFVVGSSIKFAHDASNYMFGNVSSYDPVAGTLVFNVPTTTGYVAGSGTYSGAGAWTITPAGPPGAPAVVDEGQQMLQADAFS